MIRSIFSKILYAALANIAVLVACSSHGPAIPAAQETAKRVEATPISFRQAPADSQKADYFSAKVLPIVEKCQPCHFKGGKMYAQLPFDDPQTIRRLGAKLFSRIQEENEQAIIRAFLAQAQSSEMVAGIQDLCWSSDGGYIYFSGMWHKPDYSDYHPGKWSIYRHDFKTKITALFADSAFSVAVDGTGNKIAIGKLVNGNRDIYVVDSTGKNPERITTHPGEDFAPSWSPDGKQIAFNSRRDGETEIYMVNDDATGLKRITFSNGFSSHNPAWSPDGKFIAYYLAKSDGKDQLFVMKPDGSGEKKLTNDTLNNIFPGWIDRNKITYGQGQPDKKTTKVFTLKPDGKEKQPLLNLYSFYARYSHDGSMIAHIDEMERGIKIVSAKGALIEKVFLPK